jgi:hypothetical protein
MVEILLEKYASKIKGCLILVVNKLYNLELIQGLGSKKMKKDSKTFVGLFFSNNIYLNTV